MSDHDPNVVLSLQSPWKDNAQDIWIASTLSLKRNIEQFNFPEKCTPEELQQVRTVLFEALKESPQLKGGEAFFAEDAPALEKEFLLEHFLLPFNPMQGRPGEGFILDATGEFIVSVNVKDHLQLQLLECTEDLEGGFEKLMSLETKLGTQLNYSFSRRYGFLTAEPADCGTGLEVSLYLQLPAMIHTGEFDEFLLKHPEEAIFLTGLQGTLDEIVGDVILLKNHYTIGVTEEDLLSTLRRFATKLTVYERGLRSKLKGEESAEIKDLVSRAYGVMMHSYQLEATEVLSALSLLKLGLDLGWLDGVTMSCLNALFFNCRRAHLLRHFKEEFTPEELSHKRAEYVHSVLKKLSLKV